MERPDTTETKPTTRLAVAPGPKGNGWIVRKFNRRNKIDETQCANRLQVVRLLWRLMGKMRRGR